MTLTLAGRIFLLTAWGSITSLTAYCMWKVLATRQTKKRRADEEAVIPTP